MENNRRKLKILKDVGNFKQKKEIKKSRIQVFGN